MARDDLISIEQEQAIREAAKHTAELLEQLANNAIDAEDYRIGGRREREFIVGQMEAPITEPNLEPAPTPEPEVREVWDDATQTWEALPEPFVPSPEVWDSTTQTLDVLDPLPNGNLALPDASESTMLPVPTNNIIPANQAYLGGSEPLLLPGSASEVLNVYQKGAYTRQHTDMRGLANSVIEAAKSSYRETDYASGVRQAKRIGALMGVGTLSRAAAISDIKDKIYNRDTAAIANLNYALSDGGKVNIRQYTVGASHSRVMTDYANNKLLIDDFLGSRGINARNLSNRDIDRMLNKSWAGSQRRGILIDDNMRTVLMEKKFLNNMDNKLKNTHHMKGGLKNTARAWMTQATQGTDAAAGYRTVAAMGTAAKATALVGTGAGGVIGHAAVQTISATGRIGAAIGKGATNLGGKLYSIGNPSRAAKWQVHKGRINAKFNTASSGFKKFGHEGSRLINKSMKTNVNFINQGIAGKARILSNSAVGKGTKWLVKNTVGRGARWIVVNTVGRTTAGRAVGRFATRAFERMRNAFNRLNVLRQAVARRMNAIRNAILRRTRIIRAPFKLIGKIGEFVKVAIVKMAMVMLMIVFVDVILIIIAGFDIDLSKPGNKDAVSTDPTNPNAAMYTPEEYAIKSMLETQDAFIKEVVSAYNLKCTLTDEDGSALHEHGHSASIVLYYGDANDNYGCLSTPASRSTSCLLTTDEYCAYSTTSLYKAIISMACVISENEEEDLNFYEQYCSNLLNKILHNATITDTNSGLIQIIINDAGLTDAMRLDAIETTCNINGGCGYRFRAVNNDWLHQECRFSTSLDMVYKEQDASSPDYVEWLGWTDEDAFEWAQEIYEADMEDWNDLELPGSSGFLGGQAISPEVQEYILNAARVGITDCSTDAAIARLSLIESALKEMNSTSHYFSENGDTMFSAGDRLSFGINNITFAYGLLQINGIVPSYPECSMESINALPSGNSIDTGDLLISDTGHVIIYIGRDPDGKPMTIECGGENLESIIHRNGPITIHKYDSIGRMLISRKIVESKNPYGE